MRIANKCFVVLNVVCMLLQQSVFNLKHGRGSTEITTVNT